MFYIQIFQRFKGYTKIILFLQGIVDLGKADNYLCQKLMMEKVRLCRPFGYEKVCLSLDTFFHIQRDYVLKKKYNYSEILL